MKKTLSWLLLAGLLSGCASYFMRKGCEKINWYQHGYDVAMAGKRLDADDTIKQCQKVEAKMSFAELDTGFKAGMGTYCTNDNVYAVGKSGNIFSFDMCDGQSEKKMRARYNDGLRAFCTPASGYRFGASGGIYQNVCSKTEEEPWLAEYRKGRKVWLSAVIKEKELRRQQIQSDILQLQRRRASYMNEQRSIVSIPVVHREQHYDAQAGTYQESVTQTPDEAAARRREQLNQQVMQIDYEIRGKTDEQSKLDTELSQMRTELATL